MRATWTTWPRPWAYGRCGCPRCAAIPAPATCRRWSALTRILRRERPQVVHTHAAKGGTIGRMAALLACRGDARRAVLVHTYHGHSLTGYFSGRANAVYLRVERFLGRHTTVLIAVSEEVRDELVGLGVAAAGRNSSSCRSASISRPSRSPTPREAPASDAPGRTRHRPEDRWSPCRPAGPDQARRSLPADGDARWPTTQPAVPHRRRRRVARPAARHPRGRRLGDRLVWAGFRPTCRPSASRVT